MRSSSLESTEAQLEKVTVPAPPGSMALSRTRTSRWLIAWLMVEQKS